MVSTIAILDPGGRLEVPRQGESGANRDGGGFLAVIACQGGPEEASLLRTVIVDCGVSLCALATTFLLFLVAG